MPEPSIAILAEQQVLGCILLRPDLIGDVELTEQDWNRAGHAVIWKHLAEMSAAGESWEGYVPLLNRLEETGDLEIVGGASYITGLPELVTSLENLPGLLATMGKARQRKALQGIGRDLQAPGDPEETREEAQRRLQELSAKEEGAWVAADELARAGHATLLDRQRELEEGREAGWRSSLPSMTTWAGGYRPGQVTIIGARPRMGKTALLIQECLRLAMDGRRVAFFSIEMTADVVFQRAIAQLSGVNAMQLRDGRLSPGDWTDVVLAAERLGKLAFYIDPRPVTPGQVRTRLASLQHRVGHMDVVAVDYIQILGRDAGTRYQNRNDEVGSAGKAMQSLAKSEGIAMILAAQVGRECERRNDKRPTLGDLRESGDLEAIADTALLLYRAGEYDREDRTGQMEVVVAKARHGVCGVIPCLWDGSRQFTEEVGT